MTAKEMKKNMIALMQEVVNDRERHKKEGERDLFKDDDELFGTLKWVYSVATGGEYVYLDSKKFVRTMDRCPF